MHATAIRSSEIEGSGGLRQLISLLSQPLFWAVLGIVVGPYLFYLGFRLFQRKRLILDIPRSSVLAAAIGAVEVCGKAVGPYTLVSPLQSKSTFLIDMNGRVVKTWDTDSTPSSIAYLLDNGDLARAGLAPNTEWLDDVVDLDPRGRIRATADLATSAAYVLACGDIRSDAGATVASAVALVPSSTTR